MGCVENQKFNAACTNDLYSLLS